MRSRRQIGWKKWVLAAMLPLTVGSMAEAQTKGPSSSATPYVLPNNPGAFRTTSILTTGDSVGGYRMGGIPDGLGAFDNGNGTFTVLMNHEISSVVDSSVRSHGGKGAYVSEWVIDKSTLKVLSGRDLMTSVKTDTGTALTGSALNFSRFCSADLPASTAFYNAATGLGTQNKIFMNGEENGSTSRALAHMVTGSDAQTSYVLSKFGGAGASWENLVANPFASDKTIVAASNDTTGGQNNFYVGNKTNTGLDIEKAGLTNGSLFSIKVDGVTAESRTNALGSSSPVYNGTFTLAAPGSGTGFLRSEDGAWDPSHPNDYYFVTTDRLDNHDAGGSQAGNSRLWHMHFNDLNDPTAGGTIEAVLKGISANGGVDLSQPNMMDNITIDEFGNIFIQEDVGNAEHNGKMYVYNINTHQLTQIAHHDVDRFGDVGIPPTSPFTQDEETSGIIDVSSIFGKGHYLFVDQAHYPTGDPATVEGGQLLLLSAVPEPTSIALVASAMGTIGFSLLRRRKAKAV